MTPTIIIGLIENYSSCKKQLERPLVNNTDDALELNPLTFQTAENNVEQAFCDLIQYSPSSLGDLNQKANTLILDILAAIECSQFHKQALLAIIRDLEFFEEQPRYIKFSQKTS